MDRNTIIATSNTLGRDERLKSRKLIGQLFKEGKAVTAFPVRALYLVSAEGAPGLQAGFSVSSKHFKKATDRNRIKRLLRECYRTQKHPLHDLTQNNGLQLSVFFIYTGKELPAYAVIREKTGTTIELLLQKLHPSSGT